MPIAAIIVGVMILDVAFRGTEHEFAAQLGKDFGGGQFWTWAGAIGIVGALGYVPALSRVSTMLLALVIVGMVLKNGGLFSELQKIITSPPAPSPAVPLSSYGGSLLSSVFGSGGGSAGRSPASFLNGGSGAGNPISTAFDAANVASQVFGL